MHFDCFGIYNVWYVCATHTVYILINMHRSATTRLTGVPCADKTPDMSEDGYRTSAGVLWCLALECYLGILCGSSKQASVVQDHLVHSEDAWLNLNQRILHVQSASNCPVFEQCLRYGRWYGSWNDDLEVQGGLFDLQITHFPPI